MSAEIRAMETATLGIDLASQPSSTGICLISWHHENAEVAVLEKGRDEHGTWLHDKLLVSAMCGLWGEWPAPSKVAIDAPLGWPVDFVRAISNLQAWPHAIDDWPAAQARLLRRATDLWVHRQTGKQPLSVSSDKIAYPAMRAAGLLAHYAHFQKTAVDRTGETGLICEAYPDPAIRRFGLWPKVAGDREIKSNSSYKNDNADVRAAIVDLLAKRAPWLLWSDEQKRRWIDSDDCLDALLCAMVARATERGLTELPDRALKLEASLEGWIHLPTPDALPGLVG